MKKMKNLTQRAQSIREVNKGIRVLRGLCASFGSFAAIPETKAWSFDESLRLSSCLFGPCPACKRTGWRETPKLKTLAF
jgi:hypothetical protein